MKNTWRWVVTALLSYRAVSISSLPPSKSNNYVFADYHLGVHGRLHLSRAIHLLLLCGDSFVLQNAACKLQHSEHFVLLSVFPSGPATLHFTHSITSCDMLQP